MFRDHHVTKLLFRYQELHPSKLSYQVFENTRRPLKTTRNSPTGHTNFPDDIQCEPHKISTHAQFLEEN